MARTPEEIEALLDRVEALLERADKADADYQYGEKLKGWTEKFKDKLDPYVETMKGLNGDEFDLYKESMDEYDRDYSDIADEDYIVKLIENITSTVDKLRNVLNENNVEVKADEDDVKVEAGNDEAEPAKVEAEAEVDNAEPDEKADEKAEADIEQEDAKEDTAETEDDADAPAEKTEEEELEEFMKELEEEDDGDKRWR